MVVEMRTHEVILDASQSTDGGFQRGPDAKFVVEWVVGGPSTPPSRFPQISSLNIQGFLSGWAWGSMSSRPPKPAQTSRQE